MSEEEDFSSLPLEQRLVHKVWKVRSGAYEEISNTFAKSTSESDPCFEPFLQNPSIFKSIVSDSNVVAHEAAINAINSFLQYGGPNACLKIRSIILPTLVEKGVGSGRSGTKEKSVSAILWLVELDSPDPVVDAIIPFLKHRLPRVICNSANVLYLMLQSFGAKTVDPKPILPQIPKLFAHADRKVRLEAQNIAKELFKWMGPSLETVLFPDLKPIHQKELKVEFDKITELNEKPQQTRLLRSQQVQLEALQNETGDGIDVEMTEGELGGSGGSNELDPYDLIEPVEVLSKIPETFSAMIKSSKWKERKEALEEIVPLFKAMKFKQKDDYSDFVRILAKCMSDTNLQVVQLAAEIGDSLNKGLRSDFNNYLSIIFVPTLERTKERKAAVLDPLLQFLDTMVRFSSFQEVLSDCLEVLTKAKVPKVKEETYKFITKCLSTMPVIPNQTDVDSMMKVFLKGINEAQASLRDAAQLTVGTLMKVVGERAMTAHLESIDKVKEKKIREYFEKAEVVAKPEKPKVQKPAASANRTAGPKKTAPASATAANRSSTQRSGLSRSSSTSTSTQRPKRSSLTHEELLAKKMQSIPSKREASSPLKRNSLTGNKSSRGLTSMIINKSNGSLTDKLVNVANNNFNAMTAQEMQELDQLRYEKQTWEKEKSNFMISQSHWNKEKAELNGEIEILKQRLQQLNDEFTENNLQLKSKDTKISRLKVDYEKSQQTIHELQEQVQKFKALSDKSVSRLSMPAPSSNKFTSYKKYGAATSGTRENRLSLSMNPGGKSDITKRFSLPTSPNGDRISALNAMNGDLSSGVRKLTIEEKENKVAPLGENNGLSHFRQKSVDENGDTYTSNIPLRTFSSDMEDDSWRKANEVTTKLKARIEKMKSRSRDI